MKKSLCIILALSVFVGLAACSTNSKQVAVNKTIFPQSISFDNYNDRRAVIDRNPVDENFISSIHAFSCHSASKILVHQSQNTNYSPVSLYMTLALAGTGANGTTQDEIFSALSVNKKDKGYLSTQTGNLFRVLYSDNKIGKLKIANSLWLQQKIKFKNKFIENATHDFYSSLYNVDFTDNNTAKVMSKWISDNTNAVLTPDIHLDKEQVMSILNTVYLKDEWVDRFDVKDTKPDTFYLENAQQKQCDFMNMTYVTHQFVKGEGFTSSSLGLKNAESMTFILPDKGVSVDDLLATPEKVASLFNTQNSVNGKVIFQIPKFSFGSNLDLTDTLKSLGVISAFNPDADFTGITDNKAFISNIKQQTHIAIDEKGVEAAAFTQIDYAGSSPPKDKIAEMILN